MKLQCNCSVPFIKCHLFEFPKSEPVFGLCSREHIFPESIQVGKRLLHELLYIHKKQSPQVTGQTQEQSQGPYSALPRTCVCQSDTWKWTCLLSHSPVGANTTPGLLNPALSRTKQLVKQEDKYSCLEKKKKKKKEP